MTIKPDDQLTPRELRERNSARAFQEMLTAMEKLDGLIDADDSAFARRYGYVRSEWLKSTKALKDVVHAQFQKPAKP